MKSYAQLAQAAYEAYRKQAIALDEEGLAAHAETWAELEPTTQACWLAAVKQVVAEVAVVH